MLKLPVTFKEPEIVTFLQLDGSSPAAATSSVPPRARHDELTDQLPTTFPPQELPFVQAPLVPPVEEVPPVPVPFPPPLELPPVPVSCPEVELQPPETIANAIVRLRVRAAD